METRQFWVRTISRRAQRRKIAAVLEPAASHKEGGSACHCTLDPAPPTDTGTARQQLQGAGVFLTEAVGRFQSNLQ